MIGDNSHKRLIRQISIINIFLETHTHHFKIKGTHVENNLLKIKTFLLKHKKKEYTCQCRRYGLDPWTGKIPYVPEQLVPCATTTEPVP